MGRIKRIYRIMQIAMIHLLVAASVAEAAIGDIGLLKKGVVNITNDVIRSASKAPGRYFGTGFIVDQKQGIILTNSHIADTNDAQNIVIGFFNGRDVDAKVLYRDPWHDISFIKVSPEDLPEGVAELKLAQSDPNVEQHVLIIGNNQNNNYSIQEGIINSIYSVVGMFPSQTLKISTNVRGGSSGSPIFDKGGKVVGIVFAVNDTYMSAIPVQYIRDALLPLQNNNEPPRRDMGALLAFHSLDKLVKFQKFPKKHADEYVKRYPHYMNLVITVSSCISGSPAESVLLPGDVIAAINGVDVGANLYLLQRTMNEARDKLTLTIYRDGVKQEMQVATYDLHDASDIKKMLVMDGAVFFEANEGVRLRSGMSLGSVVVTNIERGSGFEALPFGFFENVGYVSLAQILKIGDHTISELNDITKILPEIAKNNFFAVDYRNFAGYQAFNAAPIFAHDKMRSEVQYNHYSQPVMLEYDKDRLEWQVRMFTAG